MDRSWELIPGDMPGAEWRIPVLRFKGNADGPPAYLQAALHADELPGVITIDALCARLRRAEAAGDIKGDITIVPWANPIGLQQQLHGAWQGRYDLDTRVNFNRDFPLIDRPDPALLAGPDAVMSAGARLKIKLLTLALPSEIILDLHCDEVSLLYLYIPSALWPGMQDLADAMDPGAVLAWGGEAGSAFDEACLTPWLRSGADLSGKVVSTVELRGRADIDAELAERDAEGLFRFLAGRGVIAGDPPQRRWSGPVAELDHIEMIRAPVGGAVCFVRVPGDHVEAGDLLATILVRPGEEGGAVPVRAPQAGLVMSRRDHGRAKPGEDMMKLVCGSRSATARPGPLEA